MLPNFLQKPTGTAAVLIAAIGGPYAAFETNLGTAARKVLMGGGSYASPDGNNLQGQDPNWQSPLASSTPTLNYMSAGQGANYPQNPMPQQVPIPIGNGSPVPSSSMTSGSPIGYSYNDPQYIPPSAPQSAQPLMGAPYGAPITAPPGMPAGYPVNAYAAPTYPVTANSGTAYPGQPVLESRQGPAGVVPGTTHQLWDYTLGVPQLQQLQQQPGAIGGGQVHDLREVLRFDIQPGWLPQRFSRVSTVLSNVQMDGLRVPLITGTRPSDLAGTLTYYFDASQSLRRINLHGLTGDPSGLAQLMIQYYGLTPEASLGGQLFTTRWNNRVTNVLHIAPAPIIYAGADHSKYIVFLELNQANASYALSEEASGFLKNSQAAQRW